ncbi:MAG: hypothetical protein EXS05_16710 [Planctomycetaceae bacterium]|nr:hypothetical protein [Planctomycetaceae bacterium]
MKATTYTITLEAAPMPPGTPDAAVRLRHWLKQAWRQHGLRCTRAVESKAGDRQDAGGPDDE